MFFLRHTDCITALLMNISRMNVSAVVSVHLLLWCCLGGVAAAQWEDITGANPLTLINDCVQFTTNISARYLD